MLTLTTIDGKWVVMRGTTVLAVRDDQAAATEAMATIALADEAPTDTGLLPETWSGPIAKSVLTGDGRDFTAVKWEWRSPEQSRLPLMWQDVNDIGHDGSSLAGYFTDIELRDEGATVYATGRFFDNDAGRAFRDVVASAGRWGVSVDPGEVDWEEQCLEWNEEMQWCEKATVIFNRYQVIGVTGTPFPAIETAYIELSSAASSEPEPDATDETPNADETTEDADAEATAITAGVGPVRPPSSWFDDPMLDELTPLTITDDGRVFGHVAGDTCHVGWQGVCITAPDAVALNLFHTGEVVCDDGSRRPTGTLVMGTDHPALDASLTSTIDHYSHTGCGWADVTLGVRDGRIWCAGAIRPNVEDDQLRVIRASTLSGDWRDVGGELKLVAVLTVCSGGFPIPRALAASSKPVPHEAALMRAKQLAGRTVAAVGLAMVPQCAECQKRGTLSHDSADPRLDQIVAVLATIELRTRHLTKTAKASLAARIRGDA